MESPRVAPRSRCAHLGQFGEFDAEPADIVELHQQNGTRQSELTFHHVALQHIAEEAIEMCAMVGMNEQVYAWTQGGDPAHLTSHWAWRSWTPPMSRQCRRFGLGSKR